MIVQFFNVYRMQIISTMHNEHRSTFKMNVHLHMLQREATFLIDPPCTGMSPL